VKALKRGFNIAHLRLQNQRLLDRPFQKPADVVHWLGAVQSQDYPGAKWGVGQRMAAATDAGLDAAFNAGEILRTHILRPTWHFVTPADLPWMLELSGPRVNQTNVGMYRRLELDDAFFKRTHKIIRKALQDGNYRTRNELGAILAAKGMTAVGQRIAYIAMQAETAGLICSGPVRGKQQTYALVEERTPHRPKHSRDEALAMLATRYFTSHGPATAYDFAWWSGLTVGDARRGIQMLDRSFESVEFENKIYVMRQEAASAPPTLPVVHLLPNYDEHVVAYRDHGPSLDPHTPNALDGWGNALTAHIVVRNGLVVGGWRRTVEAERIAARFDVRIPFKRTETAALKRALGDYARFMGKPVEIERVIA
jgi:hypothetical protein